MLNVGIKTVQERVDDGRIQMNGKKRFSNPLRKEFVGLKSNSISGDSL